MLRAKEEDRPGGAVLLERAGDELFRPGTIGVGDKTGGTLRRWSAPEL